MFVFFISNIFFCSVNVIYYFGGLSHRINNNKSYTHGLAVHIPTDLLTVTKYVRGYMANLL
jgi:hypothetical protein